MKEDLNEVIVFHGSRSTDPSENYSSLEGFDFRFSTEGLWGRANYFTSDVRLGDIQVY